MLPQTVDIKELFEPFSALRVAGFGRFLAGFQGRSGGISSDFRLRPEFSQKRLQDPGRPRRRGIGRFWQVVDDRFNRVSQ
jgi:hypothetical protein